MSKSDLKLAGNPRIKVVFRYDDFNGESSISLERSIFEIFKRYNLPLMVGVTPFVTTGDVDDPTPAGNQPLSDQKIELLRTMVNSVGAEIALHGYSHQTIRRAGAVGCTEFEGVPFQSQLSRIDSGRNQLESLTGVSIKTLIPPWNSYDLNTLRAVLKLGMTTVSADADGSAPLGWPIHFVPATCSLSDVRRSIRWARFIIDPAPFITVLFHPFDFDHSVVPLTRSLENFDSLLHWLARQDDVAVLTVQTLRETGADLGPERVRVHRAIRQYRLNHPLPTRSVCPHIYRSVNGVNHAGMNILLCGTAMAACLLAIRWGTTDRSFLDAAIFGTLMIVCVCVISVLRLSLAVRPRSNGIESDQTG